VEATERTVRAPDCNSISILREQTGDTTMKRSLFRLLSISISFVVAACFAGSVLAQGHGGGHGGGGSTPPPPPPPPFDYRLEYCQMPAGTTLLAIYGIQQINGGIFVVGSYKLNDENRAFVYDHQNGEFTDVADLLQMQLHQASSCRAMNANGIIVGNLWDLTGARRSYWFDFFSSAPTQHFFDDQFPELAGSQHVRAGINVYGDAVIKSDSGAFCVNPFTGVSFLLDLTTPKAITDSGFIISEEPSDPVTGEYVVARWSALTGKETFNNLKIWTDWGAINELGEFGSIIKDGGAARGTACRVGEQIDWVGPNNEAYWVSSVNDSGDLGYMHAPNYIEKAMFYHSGLDQVYAIDTFVQDSFLNSGQELAFFLTERDASLTIPTPSIVGSVNDGQGDYRIYFLIPQPYEPPPTYSVLDDPNWQALAIPDNDPDGISSTISVTDNHQITGLTVTLDINHQRPGDLQVQLTGPNGVQVPLTNFTGDNPLPDDYDGSSSAGDWTLQVVDTRNKREGTLNSWSITVDY
jgi:hypothetical protein